MTLRHIAIYRARKTGNSVEEENQQLKENGKVDNGMLFGVKDEFNDYEKYEYLKENNKLKGEE